MLTHTAANILAVHAPGAEADLLARVLRSEGFAVGTAGDGPSALAACVARRPELILLDVLLPDRSGLEIGADLKRNPTTAEIPVIFLSERDDSASRIAGFHAGGVDYISKPFVAKEVLARVRVHLRRRSESAGIDRRQREIVEELRQAQQAILVTPEAFPEASFAVFYRPLGVVGGDFYDVLGLDDGAIGYFVADVSGHGVAASFLTAAVKMLLRQYSPPSFEIEDAMQRMNSVLRSTLNGGAYITACYARLSPDRRQLQIVSAGHLPPILVSADGDAQLAAGESDPLGVFASVALHKREINVSGGSRLFLYTDGLVEDKSGGGRTKGLERLRAACERRHNLDLQKSVIAVAADVKPESEVEDDLLLLGVEVRQ